MGSRLGYARKSAVSSYSNMARTRRSSGNLPAEITSFVGRRQQLGEIRKKLTAARLVSLVGPGGAGKSRLALRIAADLARGFADGAWWVELAEVRDAALVANSVVAALDLRDQAGTEPARILASYLREKRLLLVVDNCEHLLGEAAQLVAEVLRAAPNVRVITTSRQPLQVPGEQVVAVPPLELPAGNGTESLAGLRQNEAVMLFTERAAAASGAFELTTENRAAIVGLCRRLDGLPLAIELAAVRTRALAVEQILERLSDRFALLTGGSRVALPRHQTLETTIDWSYELLGEGEQALLQQCGERGALARGLDIAASMGYYWITHGTTESTWWLDQVLGAEDAGQATKVRAYYLRGWLSLLQADAATARPWIARAVTTARETGQLAKLSESLSIAATVESVTGDLEAARRYLEQAEEMTPALRDFPATIELLLSRAVLHLVEGACGYARAVSTAGER